MAKVFTAADVVVAVGPALYGRPVEDLDPGRAAGPGRSRLRPAPRREGCPGTDLRHRRRAGHRSGRRRPGCPGHRLDRRRRWFPPELVEAAIAHAEAVLGRPLTSGQTKAVRGICGEGRRVSLVLGVAGAGKTTAIRCAAEAYTAAGYQVIGTATSGQAARTLGREADLAESRTIASLLWRLDHRHPAS